MAWKDNPLGIVLNLGVSADLKRLKAEGLDFVVVEGAVGPSTVRPDLSKVVQDAYDNDLPLVLMYTPFPDQEQYTVPGNIQSQTPVMQLITRNHLIHGYIVNVDRNWTGTDYEEYQAGRRAYKDIRWSTNANISDVSKALLEGMIKFFTAQQKDIPVMTRTNDTFVQGNSQNMNSWVGAHPFYLADWRYRMPNPMDNGAYTKYVSYLPTATVVATLADLRAALPPDEAKNPLVPGAGTPLKLWEFSGDRFVHPAVTGPSGALKAAKYVLFNGSQQALYDFFKFTPKPVTPPVDDTPPDDGGDTTPPAQTGTSTFEKRLEAAMTAAAQAWLDFKAE